MRRVLPAKGLGFALALCIAGVSASLAGSAAVAATKVGGATPKTITVGQLISQTGPVATICLDQVRGAAVATAEVARMKEKVTVKQGKRTVTRTVPYLRGVEIKVNTEDDKSVASGGVTGFRAIADSDAVGFIGPCSSTVGNAFAPLLDAAKIPQVVSNAGTDALVTPEFAFRAGYDQTRYQGRVIQVLKGRGVKTVYLLEGIDNPAQVDINRAVRNTLRVLGIKVVGSYSSTATAINFTPAIQEIQQLKPDAIGLYASGGAGQTVTQATAVRNGGLTQPLFGSRTLHTDAFLKAGAAAKGALFATPYAPEMTYRGAVRFTKLFKAAYPDIAPSPIAAAGYDAMWRVLWAIHDAGPEKISGMSTGDARLLIKQMLAKQKAAQTAEGPVTYLPNGDAKGLGAVAETDGQGNVKLVKVPSVKDLLKKKK